MKSLETYISESMTANAKDYKKFLKEMDKYLEQLFKVQLPKMGRQIILENPNKFGCVLSQKDLMDMRANQLRYYSFFQKIRRQYLIKHEDQRKAMLDIADAFSDDKNWIQSEVAPGYWFYVPMLGYLDTDYAKVEEYIEKLSQGIEIELGAGEDL